ncbi:MAG: hypothetical protein JST04_13300 [Bdellovibrionales bacterium]|nr:hypothetical protein [Bdellovibrionales bacterium]
MIYRKKTDFVPSQIETYEQWVTLSRGEETPFGRFQFLYTGLRCLTWLFRENDVRGEYDGVSACVEYLYAKNPRTMNDLVDTKEFANARDFIVKELGEGVKFLDRRTNTQVESDEIAAIRQLTYLYVESKDYSPHDRVSAILRTIHQFHVNFCHFSKKDFDIAEKGARVFGEFVNAYGNLILPVLKTERRGSTKKVA